MGIKLKFKFTPQTYSTTSTCKVRYVVKEYTFVGVLGIGFYKETDSDIVYSYDKALEFAKNKTEAYKNLLVLKVNV